MLNAAGCWNLTGMAAVIGALVCPAFAADAPSDPRIDGNGRQTATWPPDRGFDHQHMRLELDFPDMQRGSLIGTMTLRAAAIGSSRTQLRLDCRGPQVLSVTSSGGPCVFRQTAEHLIVDLAAPARAGRPLEFVVRYTLDFSHNKGEGLTYSPGKPDAESPTLRAPQVHAQGESQLNSKWFPCHDSPNEKLTTEIIASVEDGFEVVSNGRLVSRSAAAPGPDGTPRARWHWLQDKPHSPYLVTLVVGKLARVDVGGGSSARPGLAMPVYTALGTEDSVRKLFGITPAMVACFERLFDEPFPWDQYAQCIVRDFVAGGMENTGCTLLTSSASQGEAGSQDSLIAHELAHQWFGDLVTCRSWAHLWLNEGWATYAEALWNEDAAKTRGQKTIRGFIRGQRARNHSVAPEAVPLVTYRYSNPDSLFSRPEDPYGKGALILHMLRTRLGDEAFFRATRAYLDRHKFGEAETDDFRREMERASGQSLQRFFDQWAYRCGLPRLGAEIEWDDATGSLSVRLEQTQTIDALNPAFAFEMPVFVKFSDGSARWLSVEMDAREAKATFVLAAKPTQVTLDPEMSVVAAVELRKDLAWWIRDLEEGPTFAARIAAAEHLSLHDSPEVKMALTRVAADQRADTLLRATAMRGATLTMAHR
jgi:aminopeptidase N